MYIKNMRADVLKHANELGVTMHYMPHATADDAESNLITRESFVPEITNTMSYFIAMHELGHHATSPTFNDNNPDEALHWEALADQWAVQHAIVPLTGKARKCQVEALGTYANEYPMPDDPDDPLYTLLTPAELADLGARPHQVHVSLLDLLMRAQDF